MRHLYIEAALGQAWNDDEAGAVADATVQALQALFAQLTILIGNDGVRALYLRALHVSLLSSERLAQANPRLDALLDDFRQKLAQCQPADSRKNAQALLESLVDLLVSLIGEALTLRLVASAWGNPTTANPTRTRENQT